MKKQYLAIILCFLGSLSLGAATVSVLVVETGLPPGDGCTPSAEIWESGMMDVFFDAGHIVSNAPCHQLGVDIPKISGKLPSELSGDFDQAKLGGADFFVLILLNYPGGSLEGPKDVYIRVFKVSSGVLLYEASEKAQVWENFDEEFLDVREKAEKVIPELNKKG